MAVVQLPAGHAPTGAELLGWYNVLAAAPVVQSGTQSVSFTTLNNTTVVVTFPTAFTTAPVVACNINSASGSVARWGARAVSVTTTGFTLALAYQSDGTTTSTWSSVAVQWLAVGT